MIVFVKTDRDSEPIPVELEEDSDINMMIAIVASIKSYPPELVTICINGSIIPPDTLISSLDLGKILYFDAFFTTKTDKYISEMYDAEQQRKIEQSIRKEQIDNNLTYAYENTPEAFVPFSLLYIKVKIGNKDLLAMLDTGAQISILPIDIAKECGVEYLIDTRCRTLTVGVGTQKSIGKIHSLTVTIEGQVWANPFVILDGPLDMVILGVDWLTKNRALIDLSKNCVVLGTKSVQICKKE